MPPVPQAPKVLVVDDSPGVLRIAETVLSEAGLRVVCVPQIDNAVARAREEAPDLMLLDDGRAGCHGYRLCQQLGQHEELAEIPIIIMNTRGDQVGDRFSRELGIVDHITKPFTPEALAAVVLHTLRRPRAGSTGAQRRSTARLERRQRLPKEEPRRSPELASAQLARKIAAALERPEPEVREKIQRVLESSGTGSLLREVAFERADGPSLTGDLAVVPIAEVLQSLSLQRQSGFLRVVHGNQSITIALKEGAVRLVTGENLPEELLLGNILVQERMIPAEELEVLLSNRRGTRQRLGNQVVKLGYLEREQLHLALRRQSAELVYELLRWSTGRFSFTQQSKLPQAVLEFEFGLTTDELLMEGFRRVDEWGLIEKAIPSFDGVPRHVPGGEAHTGPRGLTEEEQAVLRLVNNQRTVRDILRLAGGPPFETARLLYRLLAARVLTLYSEEIVLEAEHRAMGPTDHE